MSKIIEVTDPAIHIICLDCEDGNYKTTDLETKKCTYCKSFNIQKLELSTITHQIPNGDDDIE